MRYPRRMRFAVTFVVLALGSAGCTNYSDPIDPGHDTGPRTDSGTGGTDAGPANDTGSGDDTGIGPTDSGPAEDTGIAPADTGTGVDTGTSVDGGPDAGPCTAMGTCNPFDPTSCGAMACRPGAAGFTCSTAAAGTVAVGGACPRPDDCAAGLVCLSFTTAEGPRCHRMCHAHSVGECDTGTACNGTFGDACANVCRPYPPMCDIYAQDCALSTDTCTLTRNPETNAPYTGCRPAGTQNEGQPCGGMSGTCNHALICVSEGMGGVCRHVCDSAVMPDPCASPAHCTGFAMTWGVHYCH